MLRPRDRSQMRLYVPFEDLKEEDLLEELSIDGWIILKRISVVRECVD
jgi:hypothetical protein